MLKFEVKSIFISPLISLLFLAIGSTLGSGLVFASESKKSSSDGNKPLLKKEPPRSFLPSSLIRLTASFLDTQGLINLGGCNSQFQSITASTLCWNYDTISIPTEKGSQTVEDYLQYPLVQKSRGLVIRNGELSLFRSDLFPKHVASLSLMWDLPTLQNTEREELDRISVPNAQTEQVRSLAIKARSQPENFRLPPGAINQETWSVHQLRTRVVKTVSYFPSLLNLELSNCWWKLDTARKEATWNQTLINSLSLLKNIRRISMPCIHLGDRGITELAKNLPDFTDLQSICLSSEGITDLGIQDLLKALTSLKSFKDLSFGSTTALQPRGLARDLESCQNLSHQNLADQTPAESNELTPTLESVDMSDSHLSDKTVAALLSRLSSFPRLKTLNLQRNRMGAQSLAEFTRILSLLPNLERVDLSLNDFSAEDLYNWMNTFNTHTVSYPNIKFLSVSTYRLQLQQIHYFLNPLRPFFPNALNFNREIQETVSESDSENDSDEA